mmetsp:Transcript_94847/g.159349  ORF Transcript_94847/g.159349 Transcript_94847/m.159349 type:complete len:192 (-) Transcript_94847:1400-1975(-)
MPRPQRRWPVTVLEAEDDQKKPLVEHEAPHPRTTFMSGMEAFNSRLDRQNGVKRRGSSQYDPIRLSGHRIAWCAIRHGLPHSPGRAVAPRVVKAASSDMIYCGVRLIRGHERLSSHHRFVCRGRRRYDHRSGTPPPAITTASGPPPSLQSAAAAGTAPATPRGSPKARGRTGPHTPAEGPDRPGTTGGGPL